MKKKVLSLLLALTLCLGLLPVSAFAAGSDLPDWYFLFAIFKNVDADGQDKDGNPVHTTYTMTQEEVDTVWNSAKQFETYMSQVGVMRAHVDVVEIDTPLTELTVYSGGSYIGQEQAAPLLDERDIDLDLYDHVTCLVSLDNLTTSYLGITGSNFENGTGHACINLKNQEYCLNRFNSPEPDMPPTTYLHEFMHFMEKLCKKWGEPFDFHNIQSEFYPNISQISIADRKPCYDNVILNRIPGNAETGTGVCPAAWQYPPRTLRTTTELTIPSSVTAIGASAFRECVNVTKLTCSPGNVSIGDRAFWGLTKMTSVTIPTSVTSIGYASFWDTGIKDVYYAGTEAQWKAIEIGEYNKALTGATIHYSTPATPVVTVENIPASGTAKASTQTVSVDGKAVEFQMYALVDANGNATNYVKLRDMAYVLNNTSARFSVGYDSASNQISLATGQAYAASGSEMTTPYSGNRAYKGGAQTVKINGAAVAMTAITLTDDAGGDYNYFKLRDLGAALGFNVGYSDAQGVYIESNKPYQG